VNLPENTLNIIISRQIGLIINGSRRYAARMRELTSSNDWFTPLRGANQPLDRQDLLHNQSLRAHYAGEPAGQLAHYVLSKINVIYD